uniref:Stabilizer of axonemal microtubules 2 n=1 Tax=Scleropages formosus TaxID=113540 RepID=A0A8C9S415_SCLFO
AAMDRLCHNILCFPILVRRHRCFHKTTSLYTKGDKECVLTEYAEKYPVYAAHRPPKSLKPRMEYQRDRLDQAAYCSFIQSDYIPYEVTQQYVRRQAQYKPAPGEMDLGTTYKLDFNTHEVQPFVPVRPIETQHAKVGKLDTLPTYKDDFRPWDVSKRDLVKPEFTYHPPTTKFGNSTTFQDDFVPKGFAQRESFKPPIVAKLSDMPFNDLTSNRLCYVPHTLEPRVVRPPEPYRPSSQPFQCCTTHRSDFQGLPAQLPQSCKPSSTKMASDAPFQSSTEFRDRFQPWPVALPQLFKPPEYVSRTEHMELSTTTKEDFVKHSVQPFVPAKPFLQTKRPSGPFQGSTTMKEDFKPWQIQRREMAKKPEDVRKAGGKMEDLTTFKLDYTQHQIQPNVSFKPKHVPLKSEAPFDDGTMYRAEFTPKKGTVCPASFDCPPGYVFEGTDERGHRFFRKLSTQDRNKVPLHKNVLTYMISLLS